MNKSFTLIEILVVIVVIGVLSAFILIGMSSITNSANIAKGQAFANSLRNSLLINLVSEWKLDGTTAVGSPATVASDLRDFWGTNTSILCTAGGIFPHPDPTVRTGSSCISGSCIECDNVDDQYYINNPNLRYTGGGLTLEAWIKIHPTSTGEVGYIMSKPWNGGGFYNYYFYWYSDYIYFYLGGDSQAKAIGSAGVTTVLKDKWYHVVATVNSSKIMKIYINGNVAVTDSHTITTWVPAAGGGDIGRPLSIGHGYNCDQSVPTWIFDGFMDEVKLYNEAVPTSKIQQDYYLGLEKGFFNKAITLTEYNQRLVELKNNLANN
jgi:prepilin-type N-terminal cleavage/methylation domain-containing protein